MREKEQRLVITFHTTVQAMAAEGLLKEKGVSGRLIPVPREISAGCGLAWSAPPRAEMDLKREMEKAGLTWEGWQILVI